MKIKIICKYLRSALLGARELGGYIYEHIVFGGYNKPKCQGKDAINRVFTSLPNGVDKLTKSGKITAFY
ncbi:MULTISPECIES: hypothetical protein [Nostoc]|uniref:Uncharacterized protein n=1 Tax=Nostoc paludosum FACHB-159 TaxID=2692908 RepID=A0ABR8KFH1_9NOSO|nr:MULTISPECIES: hypothetical protein [Nostoc]MBD2681934.1 hypothetical protein [Nostoc sp. FACHB-857]MBD2738304.1 hypothetical protein [Nostoc paludosum FACHB-159]